MTTTTLPTLTTEPRLNGRPPSLFLVYYPESHVIELNTPPRPFYRFLSSRFLVFYTRHTPHTPTHRTHLRLVAHLHRSAPGRLNTPHLTSSRPDPKQTRPTRSHNLSTTSTPCLPNRPPRPCSTRSRRPTCSSTRSPTSSSRPSGTPSTSAASSPSPSREARSRRTCAASLGRRTSNGTNGASSACLRPPLLT